MKPVFIILIILIIRAIVIKVREINIKNKKKEFYSQVRERQEKCLLYLDIIHAFIRTAGDNFSYIKLAIDEIGDCDIYIGCPSFVHELPGTRKLLHENPPISSFFGGDIDDPVKNWFKPEFYSPDSCMRVNCRGLFFPFDNTKKFSESLVDYLKAQRPEWKIDHSTFFSCPRITIWVK